MAYTISSEVLMSDKAALKTTLDATGVSADKLIMFQKGQYVFFAYE